MKLNKLIAIATISLLSGGISMAQKALNLEDIVAGNIIQTKGIGSMTWLKDGERYSRLENNKQTGGTDIVAYRAKDNSREVIIPSSLLTDKSTGRPIPVRSVSWSADNEKVLIYNNTRRVWRYDTRGDYWVLNLKDGALRQLGKGMPESSMMFAKFSPDGTRVAYVSNNNIYVEDIDSGKITQLTKDGSDTIVNGTFDWVYEEEFSCRDGFRWSPAAVGGAKAEVVAPALAVGRGVNERAVVGERHRALDGLGRDAEGEGAAVGRAGAQRTADGRVAERGQLQIFRHRCGGLRFLSGVDGRTQRRAERKGAYGCEQFLLHHAKPPCKCR